MSLDYLIYKKEDMFKDITKIKETSYLEGRQYDNLCMILERCKLPLLPKRYCSETILNECWNISIYDNPSFIQHIILEPDSLKEYSGGFTKQEKLEQYDLYVRWKTYGIDRLLGIPEDKYKDLLWLISNKESVIKRVIMILNWYKNKMYWYVSV